MKTTLITSPFLQRSAEFIAEGLCVRSLAVAGGKLYIAADDGIYAYEDGKLSEYARGKTAERLAAVNGKPAFFDGRDVYIADKKIACPEKISDMASDGEYAYLLGEEHTFRVSANGKAEYFTGFECCRPEHIAAVRGKLYGWDDDAVSICYAKRPRWSRSLISDAGLDGRVNSIDVDEYGHIYVSTTAGAAIFDGRRYWLTHREADCLPCAPTNKIVTGRDGTRYYCTDAGLYTEKEAARSYIGYNRWLPSVKVTDVAAADDGMLVYVATDKGISKITYKEMTLEEKAVFFRKRNTEMLTREGYVTEKWGVEGRDLSTGFLGVTDNDGLWTGLNMLALCYEYAVTKDEEVLALARRYKDGMLKLMDITGIDGFTARAYRRPGEDAFGDGDPEWHPATDEKGEVEWKGETSSDEMVGHFMTLAGYYDLVADEDEKKEIAAQLKAIMDHIMDHGWMLYDADGLPTSWAHWGPDDLNNNDLWRFEHGMNSLEILTFLKIVWHQTGEEKYNEAYRRLITDHHYAMNCANHKVKDFHDCHIDDRLAFFITQPLLKYEKDPVIRQFIFEGMRDHFEYERCEGTPMWSMVYGAYTEEVADIETAVSQLEKMPLDLLSGKIINSVRPELKYFSVPEEFGGGKLLEKGLPYDEKCVEKIGGEALNPDSMREGCLYDGSVYLLPYWMGRYYNLIK